MSRRAGCWWLMVFSIIAVIAAVEASSVAAFAHRAVTLLIAGLP